MILAGHGVLHAGAWDDLLALAEKTQIPVAHTLLGIGVIDETNVAKKERNRRHPAAVLRLHGKVDNRATSRS